MRTAFSCWDNRIAPVFDTARSIHVVDSESGRIAGETRETLPESLSVQKALRLAELGIDCLVCGAISRSQYALISAYGIRVVPFVAGDLNDIIHAWITGSLDLEVFAMPGCCGRKRGWFEDAIKDDYRRGDSMNRGRPGKGVRGRGGRGDGGGRGQGHRRPGPVRDPLGTGDIGLCLCPRCGHREPREPGVPCVKRPCPDCGTAMVRQQ